MDDLEDLGRRHGSFGVMPEFFTALGEATLYGLKNCPGTDFNAETIASWKLIYEFFEEHMVRGCKCYLESHRSN